MGTVVVKDRKSPDGFKQEKICEILSRKGQKNSKNTEVSHSQHKVGENIYVLKKQHAPLSSATPSLLHHTQSIQSTLFRENWQEHNFDDLPSQKNRKQLQS